MTCKAYLMTPFTLVRLFATVHTLVAFQVVFLDEAHVTYITLKRFLTWPRWKNECQEIDMIGNTFQLCSQTPELLQMWKGPKAADLRDTTSRAMQSLYLIHLSSSISNTSWNINPSRQLHINTECKLQIILPPLNTSKRLTSVNKDVPLEVVTAPKGSKAVFTNKIFGNLYLKRTILFHYHHLGATIRHVMRLFLCSLPRNYSTPGLLPASGQRTSLMLPKGTVTCHIP